jgi:hypothetical protein
LSSEFFRDEFVPICWVEVSYKLVGKATFMGQDFWRTGIVRITTRKTSKKLGQSAVSEPVKRRKDNVV